MEPTTVKNSTGYSSYNLKVQSTDQTDELLELPNEALGHLMKSTWVSGHYIKYKRFLLAHHRRSGEIHVESLTPQQQLDLLIALETNLGLDHHRVPDPPPPNFNVQSKDTDENHMEEHKAVATSLLYKESGLETSFVHNVEFLDQSSGTKSAFSPVVDDSFYVDQQETADLATFLSRPVPIKTYTWNEGGFSLDRFYPWYEFFNTSTVKNKIHNFAFINCTLNLKVVINSSPFYYGALLFSYQPMQSLTTSSMLSTPTQQVGYSQRPHIYAYPQNNAGGEMVLPFFFNQNWLDLTSASSLQNMGEITAYEFAQLKSANGAVTGGVTIQIYAWATNVHMTGPTVKLAVQAKDEYGLGLISAPATALSKAARNLSKVPIISKYARATDIGAGAVAQIAQLFGWTAVPVISDTTSFKNEPFRNLSSAHISEPTAKLTIDPKAELTIDPRVSGLGGVDELAISYLVQKESYLCQFDWATSTTADTLLMQANPTPNMVVKSAATASGTYTFAFTPLGHTSMMFNNWRGDIIFRFRVVASQYHKGRLRITWDPVGDIVTTSASTNVTFTKIVDIGEESDIEVRVPYVEAKPWLETSSVLDPASMTNNWKTSGFSNDYASSRHNGTITVRVLNALSAPVDTSTVTVLVYVRGAENLEFANPVDISNKFSKFAVQSKDEHTEGDGGRAHPERFQVNYGESIGSIRLLLRRSALVDVTPAPASTGTFGYSVATFHKYPPSPGYDPNGNFSANRTETVGAAVPYNYTSMNTFAWMQPCFIGSRGSMRWNFNVDSNALSALSSVRVVRSIRTTTSTLWSSAGVTPTTGSQLVRFYTNEVSGTTGFGAAGTTLHNLNTQTGISVELPNLNNNRFVNSDPAKTVLGSGNDNTDRETYHLVLHYRNQSTALTSQHLVERYAAIGTDFNFLFYLNAPYMTYNANLPSAP